MGFKNLQGAAYFERFLLYIGLEGGGEIGFLPGLKL